MLILNHTFHDYYDSVLSLGIDKTIVFDRSPLEIDVSNDDMVKDMSNNIPDNICSYWDSNSYRAYPIIIGVAGKCYLGYRMEIDVAERYNSSTKKEFVYHSDDIEFALEKHHKKESLETFLEPKKRLGYKPWRESGLAFRKYNMEPAFEYVRNLNLDVIFQKYKTPIFVIEFGHNKHKLLINPILKNYNFQTVVHPFIIFQEISMYISGVLGVGEPVTVNISDKEMAKKKGFDSGSFKTLSPGKKFKRRNS